MQQTKKIRILFVTGSIAPGKNGVGDYTRTLATELIRQGQEAYILSLQEHELEEPEETVQFDQTTPISVLRLPTRLPIEETKALAKNYVEQVNPDLLSLQYVPYSFHARGLPFAWRKVFQAISGERPWHIMFHEMWIGISRVSSLKDKVIGYLQRAFAQNMVNRLQPKAICTSNPLYQHILAKAKIPNEVLPLFSSIPKVDLDEAFKKQVFQQLSHDNWDDYMVVGIFGTVYPGINLQAVVERLSEKAATQAKRLLVLSFGRAGKIGEETLKNLHHEMASEIDLLIMGMQSPEGISKLLQLTDVGISCTPVQHIGKSSIYAAMRFHDLSVEFPERTTLPEYEHIIQASLEAYNAKTAPEFSVAYIAQRFIHLLEKNYNNDSKTSTHRLASHEGQRLA